MQNAVNETVQVSAEVPSVEEGLEPLAFSVFVV
jgi:hypothetical protein